MQYRLRSLASRFIAALVVTILAAGLAVLPSQASADPIAVDFFYDSLEPDGRWVDHYKYGRVWFPRDVDDDWRPYSRGRWVWTQDYGWYWESSERFGWATYHYGRWDLDEEYGWIWIPDDRWGPAWVDWRTGGGHIGWAPLPPAVVWRAGVFDYGGIDLVSVRYRPIWCFVEERRFITGDIHRYITPQARNVTIINNTTNITNYAVVNNTVVNKSVNVTRIQQVTKTVINPVKIVQASAPGASGASKTFLNRQPAQVAVFRPEIKQGAKPGILPLAKTTTSPPAPPSTGAKPATAVVPVLPKGGLVPQAGQQAAAKADVRMRALEQRQAQEAARQRREQVIERYTPTLKPRPDIQSRQAAERQELKRIQDNRRVIVQNRAAIASQPHNRSVAQPPHQRLPSKAPPQPPKKPDNH